MSHHWRDKQRQKKECAGPSCPASGSKPKRKKYHTSKPPKKGKPDYDKPASGWTATTTVPKNPPAPPERLAQYTSPSGRSVSMKLPGGKHISTAQMAAMRKAAGVVIYKDGKPFNPPARTK
mgnify:CR=1 FL=1